MNSDASFDQRYLQILLERIAVCKTYRPRFGQGSNGVTYASFQMLYGADPFYHWFGLDHPLLYAAHKAAGGITSVYRQLGLGSEVLFRQIIQDHLGLTEEQVSWSYDVVSRSGQRRVLQLDARIEPGWISDLKRRNDVIDWLQRAANKMGLDERVAQAMRGIVMEVRQGYKSKDSKRQNADIANAAEAYTQGYLPVLVLLSTQMDAEILDRYERSKWLVLTGLLGAEDTVSTYTFAREVMGYDLAAFFQRNSGQLKKFTEEVLESLLRADDNA